jgi:hypothetical protein
MGEGVLVLGDSYSGVTSNNAALHQNLTQIRCQPELGSRSAYIHGR